jgi:hypothetical protein
LQRRADIAKMTHSTNWPVPVPEAAGRLDTPTRLGRQNSAEAREAPTTMTRPDPEVPWPATEIRPRGGELDAPATQIVRDREDYLGQSVRDIGRRIAEDQVEFFVSGDPASALLQQFERLAPEYIALHDVGTSATLHLLTALAGAAGARVQRLSIRRQGHGVALAVLQFVEVAMADGQPVRIYTTDINADTLTRQQLALVLLARSRLAALMLGELPPHALSTALGPLREAIAAGPWPNREMLLLPLGSSTALAAQAAQLVGGSGVTVRVTPQAARPNSAWSFISGAWNRRHGSGAATALNTDLARALPKPPVPMSQAATEPMPLEPAGDTAPPPRWAEYAKRCGAVKGVVGGCVFDLRSRRALARVGGAALTDALVEQGAMLLQAMGEASRQLSLGSEASDAAFSFGQQHLLLRPVPGHPGTVLHLLVQGPASALVLARMQLERVAVPD